MSTSNCVPCACIGTVYNWSPKPCMCNQFGQLPPTIPCGCSSGSSIRDDMLCCLAKTISKNFYILRDDVVGHDDQITVLDEQKALLIQAMTDYKAPSCKLEDIFERDGTVNTILNTISASINELSSDTNYTKISSDLTNFIKSVNDYFAYANAS